MPDLKSGSSSRRLLSVLCWLPALAAPWLIHSWMKDCLLNVPFMDDYVWLHLYEKIHNGTFSWWNDTFFVQMEHRLNVPAILASLFCMIKPGQITLQNWCSYFQLCVTGVNVLVLMHQTLPKLRQRWFVGGVAMWILFSPVQAYTLLWADCFSSYMAPFFLSIVLVIFQSRLPEVVKWPLILVNTILGSLSLACGLNIWIVMAVLLVGTVRLSGSRRWVIVTAWLIAFGITLALYFHNMVNQAEPEFSYGQGNEVTLGRGDQLKSVLEHPFLAARFVLIFVGGMLGRGTFASLPDAAFYAGLFLVTALLAFAILAFLKRKENGAETLPWLVFGLYSIGTGGMVALGRFYASPISGALWNRYTIHTMPIVIAVFVLGCHWWQRLVDSGFFAKGREGLRSVGPLLGGAYLMLTLVGWIYGQNAMEAWWSSRLRDATCQMFGDVPPPFYARQPLTKNLPYARRMDAIGLLHPPMVKSNRLDQFAMLGKISDGPSKIEAFEPGAPGTFSLSGFCYIHGQSRPADGLVLAWKDPQGAWIMFDLDQVTALPRYLRDTLGVDLQYLYRPTLSERHNFGSFDMSFDKSQIPANGPVEVALFAFDFLRQGFYQVPGRYLVDGNAGTVVDLDKKERDDEKKAAAATH